MIDGVNDIIFSMNLSIEFPPYSLYLMNATPLKRYTSQILSHKIFSFCEQTLQMGANDASGQGLQSALKNRHQNIFLRRLHAFEVRYLLFSLKITRQF